MRFEDQREKLVKELQAGGICDTAILNAFAKVPREEFVLPEYREYAYRNQPLPILHSQTISQPLMIAIMMQLMELKNSDIVLEVGTGSGYQSALLAEVVKEVCSIERIESLSLDARKILKKTGYKNIYFLIGDGHQGWKKAYPAHKTFNKIIVSAGAEEIPSALVQQLDEGGIMTIPVGSSGSQILNVIRKVNGEVQISHNGACSFVPLINNDLPAR